MSTFMVYHFCKTFQEHKIKHVNLYLYRYKGGVIRFLKKDLQRLKVRIKKIYFRPRKGHGFIRRKKKKRGKR